MDLYGYPLLNRNFDIDGQNMSTPPYTLGTQQENESWWIIVWIQASYA